VDIVQPATAQQSAAPLDVSVHPLAAGDLVAADRIFRLAFGTFLGLPDPATFGGDVDYIRTRWHADPSAAFGAYVDGDVVGSNIATRWGSVGFFGPLTVRPDLWDRGIGKRLMEPVVACFEQWGTRHAGLFTFPESQKHISLYQRFGFWPRFLTALMSRPVAPAPASDASVDTNRLSAVPPNTANAMAAACAEITDAIYAGLDVSPEIRSVAAQQLGDTVIVSRGDRLAGFAVCHCGAGSEAGSGTCYIKFAAVRPSPTTAADFDRLLGACEALAHERGAVRLATGVNTARHEAYAQLMNRGFRTDRQGLAMERPNDAGYNRPGVFVLDDWR